MEIIFSVQSFCMIEVFPGMFLALLIHISFDCMIEFVALNIAYEFSWIHFIMYWGCENEPY